MTRVGLLADSAAEVTERLFLILNEGKEALEMEDVWYGPQMLMPRYPCLSVEPRPMVRSFNGTHRWDLVFGNVVMVYHGKVQAADDSRRENEAQAHNVVEFLHSDLTLGGLVLFGYVTRSEPGVVSRGDIMVTATRLSWQGDSREGF